jgi:hypothetical protein
MTKSMVWVGLCVWLVGANAARAEIVPMDGMATLLPMPPDGGGLPSDLGPVSIEASRRAIQADITDWTDDKANTQKARILSCALAGAEAGLLALPVGSVATLGMVGALESYLTGSGLAHGASAPLNTPLADLATKVPFTAAELQRLQRLQNREVQDASDRIRLAIDTQSFLIQVSRRLYNEQIDSHFKRTEGFLGFFRADPEYCAAFSLVAQRDDQLIAAANQVLALYTSLEREIGD